MASKFATVALGQGQAPLATRLIEDGLREGNWVFLANCHLMTSWLPTLDKLIESFESRHPHENFRLWLSSSPTPQFPIAILQRGIKVRPDGELRACVPVHPAACCSWLRWACAGPVQPEHCHLKFPSCTTADCCLSKPSALPFPRPSPPDDH